MTYETLNDVVKDLETNPVEKSGNIYHPIPFPEFSHLKTSSNSKEVHKKWSYIKQSISTFSSNEFTNLRVLDVGANAGFYTFSLANLGATVTAFEPHPRYAPMGEFLIKHKNLNVKWHKKPFNPNMINNEKFDFALMLSVFQWMSEGNENIKQAASHLKYISEVCNATIFELGYNKGKSCITTKKLNHYAELIRFLQENTAYSNYKLLTTTKLWGSSKRFLVFCSNDEQVEDSFLRKHVRKLRI